jgi:hypothetical protein
MGFQISLTSQESEIRREYNPEGIPLQGVYEVGLKHFAFWNTVYNITSDNNVIILVDSTPNTAHSASRKYEVHIEPGYYELDDLINAFNSQETLKKSGTLIALDKRSLKIKIQSRWWVAFTSPSSIGKVLGFSPDRLIYPDKVEYSDKSPSLFSIDTIKVHCNLIRANIEDLKRTNILYDFPLDFTKIGTKIIKEPNPISYFTVNTSNIYELVIRITDQSGKLVDFLGEQVNLTLDFRPYGRQ